MNFFIDTFPRSNVRVLGALLFAALAACSPTDVPTAMATLGKPVSVAEAFKNVQRAGPIEFEKIRSATWSVPLSGLLNLEHPKAIAAGLKDKNEPIEIFTYVLKHPDYGVFLVDAGVSESFRSAENDDVSWLVNKAMNIDALKVEVSNRELLETLSGGSLAGVFLTHIHLDHIMGFGDLSKDIDVFLGPGDVEYRSLEHLATRGSTDRLLANVKQLQQWNYGESKTLDVFGDGSLFALHAPGHTAGLTVYLARTTQGSQLMMGDLTHTAWGWKNGVEPGSYSADMPTSATSLTWIKSLVEKYDETGDLITVHPGHQSLGESSPRR